MSKKIVFALGFGLLAVAGCTQNINPTDYDQMLRIDMKKAEASFPQLFAAEAPEFDWDDLDWDEDEDDEADGND